MNKRWILPILLAMPFALVRADDPVPQAAEIVIVGVEGDIADNIRHHIGVVALGNGIRPRPLGNRLRNAVRQATQAYGYYRSRFHSLWQDDKLVINVTLGDPVVWGEARLSLLGDAVQVEVIADFIAMPPWQPGQAVNHGVYERYKRNLLELCREYGFLDARFQERRLAIDLQRNEAVATLIADCGQRYRIGDIRFRGSRLQEELLLGLSAVKPGEPYDREGRIELLRKLQKSGYFQQVQVEAERREDASVDLNVDLQDQAAHQFEVGLGFGSDTGVRGTFRWDRPLLNAAGHRFDSDLKASEKQWQLDAGYRVPLSRPKIKDFSIELGMESKRNEDTDTEKASLGGFIDQQWNDNWFFKYGASIEYEDYTQGSQPPEHASYLLPQVRFDYLSTPQSADLSNARKAWLSTAATAEELGADSAFLRARLGYKQQIALRDRHLLILRGELGAVATGDFFAVPASQRFFTGGDQTVRGYGFESLSPVDGNGKLTGGKYLTVASAEYSYRFKPDWRIAVFADSGRAFNDWSDDWNTGVGIGLRWLSPVGQIGIDLAAPLDDANKDLRLHIFIGPAL